MRGYRDLKAARINGIVTPRVFIFVDALPLIATPNGWMKDFPLGFLLADPMDRPAQPLLAVYDLDVSINGGCKERNDEIAEMVWAAKPRSLTVNTAGGDMEIWERTE